MHRIIVAALLAGATLGTQSAGAAVNIGTNGIAANESDKEGENRTGSFLNGTEFDLSSIPANLPQPEPVDALLTTLDLETIPHGQDPASALGAGGEQFRPLRLTVGPLDGEAPEQVQFEEAGMIPELATWMTIFAGFGALGLSMRRNRKVPVSFT